MAKYAIISDVHANIQALELALDDAEKRNANQIICLGDLVNKYFYPSQVVDAIKEYCDIVIKGNHDLNVTTNENFRFARTQLGIDRLNYLSDLPLKKQLIINNVLLNLYHATPNSIIKMFNPVYKSIDEYAGGVVHDPNEMFIGEDPQTVLNGHSHIQYMGKMSADGKFILEQNNNMIISNDDKAILNVGAVGEVVNVDYDKNGNRKSYIQPYITYIMIDDSIEPGKLIVELIKIPYKEKLKSIYFDRLKMIENEMAPQSPKDNQYIYDSLQKMGYDEEELKKR